MPRSAITKEMERRIIERIDIAADSIINGEAKNYELYRDICGYIRGLKDAIKIFDDVEKEQM